MSLKIFMLAIEVSQQVGQTYTPSCVRRKGRARTKGLHFVARALMTLVPQHRLRDSTRNVWRHAHVPRRLPRAYEHTYTNGKKARAVCAPIIMATRNRRKRSLRCTAKIEIQRAAEKKKINGDLLFGCMDRSPKTRVCCAFVVGGVGRPRQWLFFLRSFQIKRAVDWEQHGVGARSGTWSRLWVPRVSPLRQLILFAQFQAFVSVVCAIAMTV